MTRRGFRVGDPRAIEAGKRGGSIRGAQRKRESIQRWIVRFPGVTPEAARTIYEAGYNAGTQSKYQSDRRVTRTP